MVTLIIRLCAVCAAGSLLEMAAIGSKFADSLRLICGLIMLSVTISGIRDIVQKISQQSELAAIFDCLIR